MKGLKRGNGRTSNGGEQDCETQAKQGDTHRASAEELGEHNVDGSESAAGRKRPGRGDAGHSAARALGLAGLVVDGGIMFVHYRLGQAIVDDAAYAAATALDEETLSGITNEVRLDPGEACSLASENAAENSARNGGVLGGVSCSVSGTNVTVSGQVASPTIFMSIFGINQVTFDLTSSAELKYGITEEGQ